jgi:hypothetical protein
MEALRHGDVVLVKVDDFQAIREELESTETKHEVLAEGELTGHTHQLTVLNQVENLILSRGGTTWVEDTVWMIEVPEGGAELTHEEHDRLELTPGKWLAFNQREAWSDPQSGGWRQAYVYD